MWGIVLGHAASNWGNYTLNQQLPTYLANVLRFGGFAGRHVALQIAIYNSPSGSAYPSMGFLLPFAIW